MQAPVSLAAAPTAAANTPADNGKHLQGKLYICMEYASGGNLYDYIRRQSDNLPEEQVWQLFIEVGAWGNCHWWWWWWRHQGVVLAWIDA
jgi:hypothetical protein